MQWWIWEFMSLCWHLLSCLHLWSKTHQAASISGTKLTGSRDGRPGRPQSGQWYHIAIPTEPRLDQIPADLKTRLGKGWEGVWEGVDVASHAPNLLPAPLITAGHRGTDQLPHPTPTRGYPGTWGGLDQLQSISPAGDLHSKPPSSQPCETRENTQCWRRVRHRRQRRGCTLRYRAWLNVLCHPDAAGDLQLSGFTGHHLVS